MGPHLQRLLASRKPSLCWCGKPRSTAGRGKSKRADSCGDEACLRQWRAAYQLDWTKPFRLQKGIRRDVRRVLPHPVRKGVRVLVLWCGHRQEVPLSYVERKIGTTRLCGECTLQFQNEAQKLLDRYNA